MVFAIVLDCETVKERHPSICLYIFVFLDTCKATMLKRLDGSSPTKLDKLEIPWNRMESHGIPLSFPCVDTFKPVVSGHFGRGTVSR